jgi:hypothetical protein
MVQSLSILPFWKPQNVKKKLETPKCQNNYGNPRMLESLTKLPPSLLVCWPNFLQLQQLSP